MEAWQLDGGDTVRFHEPGLALHCGDQHLRVDGALSRDLWIGREADCDLVCPATHVSRYHARIDFARSGYVLTDASTNGTWLHSEDGSLERVHRRSVRLWGRGKLFLGEANAELACVQFEIESR
jgi:predicted component of type VI protein secretion system